MKFWFAIMKSNVILVFDLDDTLYKEIDFLKSAFKEISNYLALKIEKSEEDVFSQMLDSYYAGLNVFDEVINNYDLSEVVDSIDLVNFYRNHKPNIVLPKGTRDLLDTFKNEVFKIVLITDGRSIQQRNKLNSLDLLNYFDDILISEEFGSEKPNINNFKYYENKYGSLFHYIYIGDNVKKDFISPNHLGWTSICLKDNGQNIHTQNLILKDKQKPTFFIENFSEISAIIYKIIK